MPTTRLVNPRRAAADCAEFRRRQRARRRGRRSARTVHRYLSRLAGRVRAQRSYRGSASGPEIYAALRGACWALETLYSLDAKEATHGNP